MLTAAPVAVRDAGARRREGAVPRLLLEFLLAVIGGALLSQALAAPVAAAVTSPTGEPLPDCRYDDVAAARTAYADWDKVVLDTIFALPSSYVPPDLTSVANANISGSGKVRSFVIGDLKAMVRDAAAAGAALEVVSAYRSYSRQVALFDEYVSDVGFDEAVTFSARPGHSEHQLGTAIDFKSKGGSLPWNLSDWATTKAGKWLTNNGWRYGFLLSYPRRASPELTCYIYEAWHFRYFGRATAAAIVESGLSPREWLWARGYGRPAAGDDVVDTTPPSVPSGLTAKARSNRYVVLSWNESTDDMPGTVRYRLFRDGLAIGSKMTALTYTDRPTAGRHEYRVRAIDAAGNKSVKSPAVSVKASS
jgi:zinc D-Ala-D-Ala carboxypeptidase